MKFVRNHLQASCLNEHRTANSLASQAGNHMKAQQELRPSISRHILCQIVCGRFLRPIFLLLLLVMLACEDRGGHLELVLLVKEDHQIFRVTNRDVVAVEWRTLCCYTPPHGYEVRIENGQWKHSFCGVSEMDLSRGCCAGYSISTLEPGQSIEILRYDIPRECEGKTIRAKLFYSIVGEKGERVAKSSPISFRF